MEKRIIECVPNFSEGRNKAVIQQITSAIEAVDGVKLLDVDPGEATNRTVVTFVGEPEAVLEAAFQGVKKAAEVIDMRNHKGAHPRMGATDVCPLVPIAGITLEECAELARQLAKRIADELHVPTYCYEAAAFTPERRNLAVCRAGEYEALPEKMNHEGKAPDFGDRPFDEGVARTGATAVGARDFLIAVNYNLNTTSTRRANAIAFDVREKGRPVREGNSPVGKPLKDENGKTIMKPGTLKATKAIGWFIDEYQIAQVSMNITNISVTPLHVAFDEVCRAANARGVRVTGTEIVGLIPKRTLIEAGRYFLKKQERSTGISEEEIIRIAIKSMGLDELKPFKPEEKVIEYLIEADNKKKKLVDLTCTGFAEETASESPAPGGGSISAYMGALGAALGTMVANLSSHKPGWDARWEEFSDWADKGQKLMTELLHLVDEDTEAFNRIMNVFSMPKGTDEEKAARSAALQEATLYATQVPLRTMQTSFKVFEIVKAMAEQGNPNSVTDAGVGYRIGISLFGHRLHDFEHLERGLHRTQRHLRSVERSLLQCGATGSFLLVGTLRHREYVHDPVERFGILIDQVQQLGHQLLAFVRPVGELLPTCVPAGFVRRQVGDHRTQGSAQRTHVSGNRTAARSRGLAGGLLCEAGAGQIDQFLLLIVRFDQVFDHLLFRFERLQLVQTHRLDGDTDDLLLGNTGRTLLLLQEIAARLDQRALRNQADDLGTGHTHTACVGGAANLVESHVERRNGNIGDIHRNLGDLVLVDEPADRLGSLQRTGLHDGLAVLVLQGFAYGRIAFAYRTALFAHVERDGVGATRRSGVQVVVHGDQEVACTYGGGTRACYALVEGTVAEIGSFAFVIHLLGQRLVLTGTTYGQVAALRRKGSRLVAIGRHMQLVGDALGQLTGQLGALLERNTRDRDERTYVRGTHTGMRSLMITHIDNLGSFLDALESRFQHGFGFSDEGNHRTVGRFTRIDVEQLDSVNRLDCGSNLLNNSLVTALAKVGHAFNNTFFHVF